MNTFKKDFLCLDNKHILGDDQGYTPGIMNEILTTARDLELEVYEDDIDELIMGHEDELTTEELQEILNEEHQETQRIRWGRVIGKLDFNKPSVPYLIMLQRPYGVVYGN
ncbi:hypothetical protein TNCV_3894051 [Trichonephila clavipes]|nr:hypothetical protein TNCV_3894051 [Trichonephila clavipes]